MSTIDADFVRQIRPAASASLAVWQEYIHAWAHRKGWYKCQACKGEGFFLGVADGLSHQCPMYSCQLCEGGVARRNVGEFFANLHSELSEAWEFYRSGNGGVSLNQIWFDASFSADKKPDGFAIELADVLIRLLDLCGYLDIDIMAAVAEKMKYNETRPERHGGKLA